jgi:hypothetical protein
MDALSLVAAASAIAIAVAAIVIAVALWRLAADARATAADASRVLTMLDREVPPTLEALRGTARELDELAGESAGRLLLLERLAEEGEQTMIAVRELSASVNEIVRGPAETVNGVRRSARMVGSGISHGADRLRRALAGEETREDDDA